MAARITTKEHTKFILAGYIRDIQSKLSSLDNNLLRIIPSSVINVILLYLHNLFINHGIYIWHITDPIMVQNILNAKMGEKFTSDPFKIARLNCQLEIYPNGNKEELSGFFIIHCKILSLPKYIKHIAWSRIFQVLECKAGAPYTRNNLNVENHDHWSKKCELSDLIEIDPNTITVRVELMINRIVLNDTSILDDISWKHGQTLPTQMDMNHHLEMKLNKQDIDVIRNNKAPICSAVMNDIWSISIFPFYAYMAIYLKVCQWPMDLQGFMVKYKIIGDMMPEIKFECEDEKQISRDKQGLHLNKRLFALDSFDNYNCETMTITLDMELSQFVKLEGVNIEEKGEILDPVLIAYLLSL